LKRQIEYTAAESLRFSTFASKDALLVVLELHDQGLDVLALGLPLLDALLRVRVEVFLLLIEQRLGLERINLLLLELLDSNLVLGLSLVQLELGELLGAHALLLLLLLFSHLQLFVAHLPELGKLMLLLPLGGLGSLLALNLELAAPLDGRLHLCLALLLLLEQSVCSVFGLGHLPVQHFLLVVL